jgi:alginate O-acetyltransferase complex protein AlgI
MTSIADGAERILAQPILFTEFRFVWIFALIFGVHWALRGNTARKVWLLAASHAFYTCFFIGNPLEFFPRLAAGRFAELPIGWWFPALLWLSTIMDWRVGLGIADARSARARRAWLLVSVAANLGVLAFFKYYGFFEANVRALFDWIGLTPAWEPLRIFLPYGISFYTFQSLSYSIEVYRGRLPAERSFLNLAFFIAFFPQVVAGPIVRAMTFLPQTRDRRRLDRVDLRGCATLFLIGFVKKACIADGLAPIVDAYFVAPASYDAASAWAAMLCYAVQIYGDFSGYTDMAIAVARSLGYELTPNFAFPYLSRNVAEFWRRWHISLSTWLRDYLYISLGGNRGSRLFTARNLMLTMLLGGLWHGAAWTFVAWGGLHGLALVVHREWVRRAPAPRQSLRLVATALTFTFVVLAWVPFRANDVYVDAKTGKPLRALADGFHPERADRIRHPIASVARNPRTGDWHAAGHPDEVRVRRVTGGFGTTATVWRAMLLPGGAGERTLVRPLLWALLAVLAAIHALNAHRVFATWWRGIPDWSYATLLGAAAALALFFKPVAYRAFIYFQF